MTNEMISAKYAKVDQYDKPHRSRRHKWIFLVG